MTTEQEFHLATQLLQRGQLPQARDAYARLLANYPGHADALHFLGIIESQLGRPDRGAECILKAIEINPNNSLYHNNLGTVLKNSGKLDQAINAYRRSIEINQNDPLAYCNLGNCLRDHGAPQDAAQACRRALQLKPDYAEAFNNLGNALKDLGLVDDMVEAYRRAAELRPDIAEIQCNLGNALLAVKDFKASIAASRRAIELNPAFAEAFINLGTALSEQKLWPEAIDAYRRATQLRPDLAEANLNLANALSNRGFIEEAQATLSRVKRVDPAVAKAHMNLGYAFMSQGMLDQAIDHYRRAVAINPTQAEDHSYLVYSVGLHPAYSARRIFEEASAWATKHAKPLADEIQVHGNERSPERKLKIGYVSPDYRDHVLGWFMPPILANHDREKFEVHCFSAAKKPDDWTRQLQSLTDRWHDVANLDDAELADLIRREQIDILVDQAVHCIGNRLLTFARKPAPVQVSYLAYFGTTGMGMMDYLLCDPYLELLGDEWQYCFSEKLIRLPRTYWCYRPNTFSPEVGPLPAIKNGCITFGCLNNFSKVNPSVWNAWCRILTLVPNSRLIVHAGSDEALHQVSERTAKLLIASGIDPGRVELLGRQTVAAYLATYQRIDIALDPFPYTGGATTCDALYMGVPVITLAGKTSVSRGGYSLLSNVGLGELVAHSTDQYVQLAIDLAFDIPRLKKIHENLRPQMQASALMDEPRFIGDLEAAYRIMWERWCGKHVTDRERAGELFQAGYLDDAGAAALKAIELDPNAIEARVILANVYKGQGLLDESIQVLREMVKLAPTAAAFHSNLVFTAGLHPAFTPQQIYHEARQWARVHADPFEKEICSFENDRSPDRKLKIGYVSPDFTAHPVGRFLVPILSHHDRQRFEIHCFSNVTVPDNYTQVFRQACDHWHEITGMSDPAAADLIRKQQIDILIDLALHTAHNRLPVFARKPAPVQATYLGYCGTSGVRSIDYVFCDPWLIASGDDEQFFSEEPLRLPKSYWCYRPPNGIAEPGPLPVLTEGSITFGCFNNFSKVNAQVVEAWCRLLYQIRNSRLLLHAHAGSHRERIVDLFVRAGIDAARIGFIPHTKLKDYFKNYQNVDIALDTFPFSGGTTTCDALWMGLPVISVAGQTSLSRGGLSILSNIGLPELAAESTEDYIRLAIELASDLPRLKNLRETLRQKMRSSPLMDELGFVSDLETAYRSIWKKWCGSDW